MTHEYEVTAFAKINLFLRVCGTLPNGYHRLYTLMQEISLGDDVTVNIYDDREFDIGIICDRTDIEIKKNLCYKAADRFYSKYAKHLREHGVEEPYKLFGYTEIEVKKNTPSEAGLGGGSSDAAAVIKILQEHYNNPFTMDELVAMAVGIGADVPFFLYGGSAICEGVGEIVTPVEPLEGVPMILIKPAPGVSTPACFKAVDAEPITLDELAYKSQIENALNSSSSPIDKIISIKDILTNDLQKPAVVEVPQINDCIDSLYGSGAVFAMMSGSGSSSFGVYDSIDKRDAAIDILAEDTRLHGCKIYPIESI